MGASQACSAAGNTPRTPNLLLEWSVGIAAALHQNPKCQGRQGSQTLSISREVVAFSSCSFWLLEQRWSQVCAGWLPGEGCVLHILSSLGKQWPEVAQHPSHPLLGVLGWEHPACAGHGSRYSPADPTLLLPSQARVTPWEQERCFSSPSYHPSASTALLPVPEQVSASLCPPSTSHLPSPASHPD